MKLIFNHTNVLKAVSVEGAVKSQTD